ncbi:MAG: hypothetical protein RIR18_1084 [Pseudomonadota bacterium]|jgi:filamentous hemagglutinin family protein
MNHSYRLVWNDRTERFVPAPETATACGKCGGTRILKPLAASLFAALSLTAAHAATPVPTQLPDGGRVVAGQATIAQTSPARMDITQTSNRAILEWNRFDIGSQAQVNFVQPSASSVALNRVLAGDASQIMGQLTANGQVWLMNPAGVIFGAGSRVDVGGIVATSMSMTNEDFLAGRAQFQRNGATGKVENHGQINGQLVALLAPEVINDGIITARMGNVVLAAGERITLEAGANGYLQVAVDPATVSTLVNNRHLIQADGGQVVMSAQAADTLLSAVVANSGTVQAQTLENHEGRILLLASMANGEVQQNGLLDASAPIAGNGGFVETSAAKVSIDPAAHVTTRAANGQTGTWLIDPNDYTIAATGGDITGAQLSSDLSSNNITIQSTNGATSGNGDIFVNDAVSWSQNTLTLTAVRDISLNAVMTASGTSSLVMNGSVKAGFAPGAAQGFAGRVDFPGRSGTGFLTINGNGYYVLGANDLGVEGDATTTTLQGMQNNLGGYYALGANINASATSGWNSGAGWQPLWFYGKFDGLGHTISNLTINRPSADYQGLFGNIDDMVSNVGLVGGSVTGRDSVGMLVGLHNGIISNSYVTGSVAGNNAVGGLIGDSSSGDFINSYATASVTGNDLVGGLSGYLGGGTSPRNNYATGSVAGNNLVGGLIGKFFSGSIINSYATGSVSGVASIGGLVGYVWAGRTSNSFASGSVTGTSEVGGLIGFIDAIASSRVAATNSYATGSVTGTSNVGGLIGSNASTGYATVSSSYWNTETTGQNSSAEGTGKTTAEMKQQATYVGWDISATSGTSNIWRIYEGQSTPVLRALQQNLTVTANTASKTYDGLAYSGGNGVSYSLTGAPLTGTVSYGGTSQGATNVGSYVITPSGLSFNRTTQQDYQNWGDITYVNGALTVSAAPLTVTANADSKTYDGLAYTGGNGVGYSGFVNSETASVLGGTLAYGGNSQNATNAGSYTITPSGLTSSNYTISFVDGALTINPAIVTLALGADNKSKTYGATDPSLTYTLTSGSLSSGDSFSGNLTRDVGENVGDYAIRQGTVSAGSNYTINFTNGVLTISATPLIVTAANTSKTYDGHAYSGGNGVSYSGFVNNETAAVLGGTLAYGGNSQNATNAGSYTISPSGLTSGNYTISFVDGALTVSKAPLTVTANAASKAYDGLAYTGGNSVAYSGFVNNETASALGGTLAYGGNSQNATNAGSYTITPSGLSNGNYTISFVDGGLTISPVPLTVTAANASKTYDGHAYSGGNGVSYSGFVNNETAAVLGGTLAYSGTSQGATNTGSYTITPSGLTSGNYTISVVDGSLTVNPAPATESKPTGGMLLRVAQLPPEVIATPTFALAGAIPHVNIPDGFISLPVEE